MYHDRAISAQRGPGGNGRRGVFGNRSIHNAVTPVVLVEILHGVTDVPGTPQPLADNENVRVIFEKIMMCVQNSFTVRGALHPLIRHTTHSSTKVSVVRGELSSPPPVGNSHS